MARKTLPVRVERDAAIAADLLAGVGVNECARRHGASKTTVGAVKKSLPALASEPVRATAEYRPPPINALTKNSGAPIDGPDDPAESSGPVQVHHLGNLIAAFIVDAFQAQRALVRLVLNPEWSSRLTADEAARLLEVLNDRAIESVNLIRPSSEPIEANVR